MKVLGNLRRTARSVRFAWEHTFVTHPAYVRDKARQMRAEKDLTIDEISERLAVSRQTVFHWVRDLPLKAKRPRPLSRGRGLFFRMTS